MDEEHKYAFIIGKELGLNILHNHPNIAGAGYCEKHGSYTRCLQNTKKLSLMHVEDECPYCKNRSKALSTERYGFKVEDKKEVFCEVTHYCGTVNPFVSLPYAMGFINQRGERVICKKSIKTINNIAKFEMGTALPTMMKKVIKPKYREVGF